MAPSERALLRSAESFASKLHPPMAPSLCPVCFFQFCDDFFESEGAAVYLQMKCHAFWAAAIGFISEHWTPSAEATATARLEKTHRECRRCTPMNARITERTMFAVVFSAACRALSCALDNRITKVPMKGFGDRLGRWPTSVDHLFPYGAERTISSLVDHLADIKAAILAVIGLVIVHRPVVFPLLLRDEYRPRVLTAIISLLDDCTSEVLAALSLLPQPVPPALRDSIARAHTASDGPMLMLHLLAFGQEASLSDHKYLMRSWEAKLFAALDPTLRLLEGPVYMEDWTMQLVRYLWSTLSEAQQRELGYRSPPAYLAGSDTAAAVERVQDDPYAVLYCFLKRLVAVTQHACGAPKCTITVHDKATPGAFSRCGRCRFMQYCSRQCQKNAWTDPELPHKAICDMLHELFIFAKLDTGIDQFSRVCRDNCFPVKRADVLTKWAGAQVMSHEAVYASLAASGSPKSLTD